MIGIFSRGMSRIPHLETLLGDEVRFRPGAPDGLSAIAGWGHKPTADKAKQMAAKWSLPYLAVEDGFLRSLGLGVQGHAPLSIIVDDVGVYYDATGPSQLENMIRDRDFSDAELRLARKAIEGIVANGVSKYNHAPELADDLPKNGCERVLLIDQTQNDASVKLGLADESTFLEMARAAREEHPKAEILIKVHPDVTSGKKVGYLAEADLSNVTVIDYDVNPLSLLKQVDHVYTVSSQMGFEALLRGVAVTCFGMPFYAGRGLTCDRLSLDRRSVGRSLEEVFAAAYICYARYLDPFTGQLSGIMESVQILADQKRHNDRNRGDWVCAGFSWWRRGFASHLFKSTDGNILFENTAVTTAVTAYDIGGRALVWSAKTPPGTWEACEDKDVTVIGVEDGFLRSTGLGSDFYWPYSLCMDSRGAYFDPSGPSDLEVILKEKQFDEQLVERATALRKKIVASGITKYNVGLTKEQVPFDSGGRQVVLVVGQVADDKSVELGGLGIASDRELLEAVRVNRPDAYLIYKPHPDVVSGNRDGGAFADEGRNVYDVILTDVGLNALFPVIDELHTLTSLSGFEALLRGISVYTYGGPFYAGWGLTEDRLDFPRRNRILALDELVAGVLILYPTYYDWRTEMFCGPEVVLQRLADGEEPRQGVVRRRMCRALQTVLNILP
ncbi:Capsule polysaccharide modification protein LipA (plasmid) [Pseudodesulfovibrio profundus]|uniref:Capsule polysaccharide modification protein LipA n=1 Tax=Pseudodesulfovibrio profundus TaxID=57320 RepID=A0A2C8FG13_9BACT|nr:capsular polysaccharide biosynthesis protein [Pseudodesulfovibrio profundus]SOB62129.1 Capsule polysaccharide modification protein LipA [Pseudodesulfovibrio profundus]